MVESRRGNPVPSDSRLPDYRRAKSNEIPRWSPAAQATRPDSERSPTFSSTPVPSSGKPKPRNLAPVSDRFSIRTAVSRPPKTADAAVRTHLRLSQRRPPGPSARLPKLAKSELLQVRAICTIETAAQPRRGPLFDSGTKLFASPPWKGGAGGGCAKRALLF